MSSAPVSDKDRALTVTTIRVTVHTQGYIFEYDSRSSNHASIFLVVSGNESVRLNMVKAGATDTMGTYLERSCPYIHSATSLYNVDIIASPGLTVGHFLNDIQKKGLDKYQLHRSGVGCRFWV